MPPAQKPGPQKFSGKPCLEAHPADGDELCNQMCKVNEMMLTSYIGRNTREARNQNLDERNCSEKSSVILIFTLAMIHVRNPLAIFVIQPSAHAYLQSRHNPVSEAKLSIWSNQLGNVEAAVENLPFTFFTCLCLITVPSSVASVPQKLFNFLAKLMLIKCARGRILEGQICPPCICQSRNSFGALPVQRRRDSRSARLGGRQPHPIMLQHPPQSDWSLDLVRNNHCWRTYALGLSGIPISEKCQRELQFLCTMSLLFPCTCGH